MTPAERSHPPGMRFDERAERSHPPGMRFDALIFDFDGVLIESEYVGNLHLAECLTALGHPTSVDDALTNFVGLSGPDVLEAVARWIGGHVPQAFHEARRAEDERVLREGLAEVAGAARFVRALPDDLPVAIASSSTTHWIGSHLDHLGLRDRFEGRIFSGREHVARGKPAPDVYLHAADALGVPITRTAIIEDSLVGVTGAVASGAYVIGLAAGRHCADGHDAKLIAKGAHVVARNFDEVAALLNG
jgi:HAD superfamily hydrolase (TIGR01509 family)